MLDVEQNRWQWQNQYMNPDPIPNWNPDFPQENRFWNDYVPVSTPAVAVPTKKELFDADVRDRIRLILQLGKTLKYLDSQMDTANESAESYIAANLLEIADGYVKRSSAYRFARNMRILERVANESR